MEYEGHSRNGRANWEWVREEVNKSDAFILILSKNATGSEHTRNWIAFELGIAANSKPPKQVTVIKEEDVIFPLPYLGVYFPYPLLKALESVRWDTPEITRFMRYVSYSQLLPLLNGTAAEALNKYFPLLRCMDCLTSFMMPPIPFRVVCCPNCDLGIGWEPEKWLRRDTEGKFLSPIAERQPCKRDPYN